MISESPKDFLRDLLVGLAACVCLVLFAIVFHHQTLLLFPLILLAVLIPAILRSKSSANRSWLHGLVVGLGMGFPILILALVESRPKPNPWAWVFCACMLLFSTAAAQSAAFWRKGQRALCVALAIVAVTAVLATSQVTRYLLRPTSGSSTIDKPLPALALTTLDGAPINLNELQGHVTVIDFWGIWCAACVFELPALNDVRASYAANPNVHFLLVDSELNGDNPQNTAKFLRDRAISIPAALDPEQTFYKLGANVVPQTLLIDQRGHIRMERSGYPTNEEMTRDLHNQIDALLAAGEGGLPKSVPPQN